MLVYLAGNVRPSCGYVGLCWPEACWAKRSEKWEQQKNTVKRRIFWWSAAYLGAMLADLGAMWAYLGAMLVHLGAILAHLGGYVGRSWGYVGPSWGYLGPSWGPCWPILGAMLAHLEAYVGPCWPILSHKIRKMRKIGKSTKHRKTRGFLAGGEVGGRGRSPSLLRRGEICRTARTRPGGPWPDLGQVLDAKLVANGPFFGLNNSTLW